MTTMPGAGTKMTRIKALATYFNEGAGYSLESESTPGNVPAKRGLKVFQEELKALSEDGKNTLAAEVCEVQGWVLA